MNELEYSKRNDNFNKLCLAEFATQINVKKKRKNNDEDDDDINDEIEETQRHRTKILRYMRYRHEDDAQNFYREHILLLLPWKNELYDVENQNCEDIYKFNEEQILQKKKTILFYY